MSLPRGYTEEDIRKIAEYYDNQSPDEALAEAEAEFEKHDYVSIMVPRAALPEIRRIVERILERASSPKRKKAKRSA